MRRRRKLLALGALGGLLVVVSACNALIELDEFSEGECSGGRCPDPQELDATIDASDAAEDAPLDARVDAVVDAEPGARPVSWASWPMPNAPGAGGDAGPADASPAPVTVSFSPSGPDEIVDNVTKLRWMRALASTGQVSYADAAEACTKQGGRLPTRIELVTLLDPEARIGSSPAIDSNFASTTDEGAYWTSSEFRPFNASQRRYWTVRFDSDTFLESRAVADRAHARCVKGAAQ